VRSLLRRGLGSPLVLIHGLGGAGVVWHRNVAELSLYHTVYVPDLWGPGRYVDRRFTTDSGVRFLLGFLDANGVAAAHLVGSSLGGLIVGFTAIQASGRVLSLTLVDSAGLGIEIAFSQRLLSLPLVGEIVFRPSAQRVRSMLRLLLRNGDAVSAELVDALHMARLEPGVSGQMLGVLRAGVNVLGVKQSVQLLPHLGTLTVPTLVIWGDMDPLFPVSHGERAVESIPDSWLRVFPNSGHWCCFEYPERFNAELLSFLGERAAWMARTRVGYGRLLLETPRPAGLDSAYPLPQGLICPTNRKRPPPQRRRTGSPPRVTLRSQRISRSRPRARVALVSTQSGMGMMGARRPHERPSRLLTSARSTAG
jgi:pimeloyl-ACP methyl ester carboxylesterase